MKRNFSIVRVKITMITETGYVNGRDIMEITRVDIA